MVEWETRHLDEEKRRIISIKTVECDLEDVVKSLTKNKKTKNEVEIMTSRKVAVIKFNGVEEAEINEFEKAGLTSWIKSLISEMEEYL